MRSPKAWRPGGFLIAFVLGVGLLNGCATTPAVPMTPAQQAEAEAIRKMLTEQAAAMSARDFGRAAASFAEGAQIDSTAAGRKVNKVEWQQAMQQIAAPRVEISVATVSFSDPSHATAVGDFVLYPAAGGRRQARHEWKIQKRDGRWLIVETRYLSAFR